MRCSRRNEERGYTLIELLVSMGIAMVILAAVSNSFTSQSKAFNAQELINEMQQNARAAMDLMAREIKMAGYNPNGVGFAPIATFTSDTFRFRADIAGAAGIDALDEDIEYSRDANNRLLRDDANDGADPVLMAENITSLTFQYFDADRNVTTDPDEVRQILVTITARTDKVDPNSGEYRTYNVTSWVTPNNLGY